MAEWDIRTVRMPVVDHRRPGAVPLADALGRLPRADLAATSALARRRSFPLDDCFVRQKASALQSPWSRGCGYGMPASRSVLRWPRDLRVLSRLMQFPRVHVGHHRCDVLVAQPQGDGGDVDAGFAQGHGMCA